MSYSDEVLADAPLIYLPNTGNSLTANSGSRTVTVNSSGGITWETGPTGNPAPKFAGVTTAARINYNLNPNDIFNMPAWTLEGWFKVAVSEWYADIFNTYDANNELALLMWRPEAYGDDRKLKLFYRGSGAARQTFTGPAITDTTWHHVAITKNSTTLTVYLDGSSRGTLTANTNNIGALEPFRVGAYGDNANNENFNGNIYEMAVYPTALSPARVLAHHTAGHNADTVGTWTPAEATASAPTATALVTSPGTQGTWSTARAQATAPNATASATKQALRASVTVALPGEPLLAVLERHSATVRLPSDDLELVGAA